MFLRVCILMLGLIVLSGCAVTDRLSDGLAALGPRPDATGSGIRTLSLLQGDVRVRGPEGYCIDQSASRARSGFAVLAGCALLSEDAAIMPNLDGLITVQFGDPDTASVSGNEEAFSAFLRSDAGRGLLAMDGTAQSITDAQILTDREGILVRFQDASGPAFAGTTAEQWRGFLDVNGRLVTISVLSFQRNQLSRSEGERLLVVAMAELAEVNATTSQTDDPS